METAQDRRRRQAVNREVEHAVRTAHRRHLEEDLDSFEYRHGLREPEVDDLDRSNLYTQKLDQHLREFYAMGLRPPPSVAKAAELVREEARSPLHDGMVLRATRGHRPTHEERFQDLSVPDAFSRRMPAEVSRWVEEKLPDAAAQLSLRRELASTRIRPMTREASRSQVGRSASAGSRKAHTRDGSALNKAPPGTFSRMEPDFWPPPPPPASHEVVHNASFKRFVRANSPKKYQPLNLASGSQERPRGRHEMDPETLERIALKRERFRDGCQISMAMNARVGNVAAIERIHGTITGRDEEERAQLPLYDAATGRRLRGAVSARHSPHASATHAGYAAPEMPPRGGEQGHGAPSSVRWAHDTHDHGGVYGERGSYRGADGRPHTTHSTSRSHYGAGHPRQGGRGPGRGEAGMPRENSGATEDSAHDLLELDEFEKRLESPVYW
eukprot:jgi/Mesvir1/25400/Mv01437-RA.1